MNKLIFILIMAASFTTLKAQHTLQYNQVKLIDTASRTVPAGYVWKIVSILPSSAPIAVSSSSPGNPPGTGTFNFTVNSKTIYPSTVQSMSSVGGYTYVYSYTNSNGIALPIWLPAGTTLAAGTNIQYISVIEFYVQ